MLDHVTFLKCDAPGCLVKFSSEGLPSAVDRYVYDAAIRHGWTIEGSSLVYKALCPAHSEKAREALSTPTEKAVRLLINNPSAIRSAPPFLIGQLKQLLTGFNAKTYQWRNS